MRQSNLTQQQILAIEQGVERTSKMQARLKGYAGWLVLIPDSERCKTNWHCGGTLLERRRQASFPLKRSIKIPDLGQGMVKASEATANFQQDINGFLDHWGLIGMATWDLPEPQGPLIPALLPANAPAMPSHGLHIFLPIHFPLTGADSLLSEIQEEQVRLAKIAVWIPVLPGYPTMKYSVECWKSITSRRRFDLVTADRANAADS